MASAVGDASTSSKAALEQAVLDALKAGKPITDSLAWASSQSPAVDHQTLVGVLKSLESDEFVALKSKASSCLRLSPHGEVYLAKYPPEYRVYLAVPEETGIPKAELEAALGVKSVKDKTISKEEMAERKKVLQEFKNGFNQNMRHKWLACGKDRVVTRVVPWAEVEPSLRTVLAQLRWVRDHGTEAEGMDVKYMKSRKMVDVVSRTVFAVAKGDNYQTTRVKLATDLTSDMLEGDKWKTVEFKPFNFDACGKPAPGGHLHPLLKVRAEFRSILLEMGFEEMPTARFVESSFWNFDALFQPQSHPARDAHDTFFIAEPAATLKLPEDYVARVKDTHETGGDTGSIGYRYSWQRSEANKNLLRTHTTAISAQMLYRLSQQSKAKGFKPVKMFSIDRVFRNEALDATHLAEFHQVEGLVVDYDLSLGDLMGVMREFFARWGITDLRFKPAYNPYTEPSMEIFAYHPDLKTWTEIGNSGIFRPEMLLPMGLPSNVRVIAWGLSLERPTMIRYGISNIRTLFGHQVQLDSTRDTPLCNFQSASTTYDHATTGVASGRPYPLETAKSS